KSMAAATSRQKSLGITTELSSGMPFTLPAIPSTFLSETFHSAARVLADAPSDTRRSTRELLRTMPAPIPDDASRACCPSDHWFQPESRAEDRPLRAFLRKESVR